MGFLSAVIPLGKVQLTVDSGRHRCNDSRKRRSTKSSGKWFVHLPKAESSQKDSKTDRKESTKTNLPRYFFILRLYRVFYRVSAAEVNGDHRTNRHFPNDLYVVWRQKKSKYLGNYFLRGKGKELWKQTSSKPDRRAARKRKGRRSHGSLPGFLFFSLVGITQSFSPFFVLFFRRFRFPAGGNFRLISSSSSNFCWTHIETEISTFEARSSLAKREAPTVPRGLLDLLKASLRPSSYVSPRRRCRRKTIRQFTQRERARRSGERPPPTCGLRRRVTDQPNRPPSSNLEKDSALTSENTRIQFIPRRP